jgi:hypothetical protein
MGSAGTMQFPPGHSATCRFAVAAAVKGPVGREFGTGVRTPETILNVSPLDAAMAVEIVAGNPVGDPLIADDRLAVGFRR